MIRLLLVISALAVSSASLAQSPEPAKPLTYEEVKQVAEGLTHLDYYEKLAKDGAREFTVKVYFDFKEGLRALIGDNLTKARGALKDLNEKNNELIRQYAEGGDKVPEKNMPEFSAAQRKLLASSSGVTMQHIKIDELKLGENKQITGTPLSLLDPILDK